MGEYNLQQRSVDYIVIDSNNEKIPKISKEDSFKYYEENKTNFLSDELRSSETLLDANKYAKKLTVTEDEIKLLYEERKESLIELERRYLKQILVQDKDKAYSIHEKLKKIGFTDVAKSMANLTGMILI